jgi:hypothetical protein
VLKTGSATIVMKQNDDITIEGKTIIIKGLEDVIIEGQKVLQNTPASRGGADAADLFSAAVVQPIGPGGGGGAL